MDHDYQGYIETWAKRYKTPHRKIWHPTGVRTLQIRRSARKRYTTVELIEEVSDWASEPSDSVKEKNPSSSRRLAIKVEYWETELREKVKASGGIWRPRQKLWEMSYDDVVALSLESRVVTDDG